MPTTAADLGLVAPEAPKSSAGSLGLTPPGPEPSTTASGLAASAARGAAPYAAGAGVGAALGAPFAGVGAIPGAIAGMGAVGLTQLGEDIYNWVGNKGFGLPRATTPQDAMDRVLDQLGVKRPATGLERMAESTAGLLPFGISPTGVLSKAIADNSAEGVDRFIRNQYIRAIKPSVTEGRTSPQFNAHMAAADRGIDHIVGNKEGLYFADKVGETSGKLPETIEQFGDAIAQTKAKIFSEYNAKASAADKAGLRVESQPIVDELNKLASDRAIQEWGHGAAKYAADKAAQIAEGGAYSPLDAQNSIQALNRSLKAFYSNPGMDTATKAYVDSMVANQLRGGLDRTITEATGPGYQALKNAYGDLRSIEQEVMHRAIVEGRKNAGGGILGSIADVASAEEVIRGLITLNPASLATGAGIKATQLGLRWLRDPNRAVRRIFEYADQRQRARQAARDLLPTYREEPLLQLPPPEVAGGAPWISTGQGVFPSRSGFTMQNPNPSLYEKGR